MKCFYRLELNDLYHISIDEIIISELKLNTYILLFSFKTFIKDKPFMT